MGVSWLFQYPVPDSAGRLGPQIVADLEKQLITLGAQRLGTFTVDSDPYFPHPNIPGLNTVNLCHSTEYPMSSFAIIISETTGTNYAVADRMFDQLMQKLQSAYASRQNFKVECKGPKFALHDFVVKMGSVAMSGSTKGLLIEIEYNPCSVPSLCTNLMKEFSSALLGQIGQQVPIYMNRFKDAQFYGPIDTIMQYLMYFIKFRGIGSFGQNQNQNQNQLP